MIWQERSWSEVSFLDLPAQIGTNSLCDGLIGHFVSYDIDKWLADKAQVISTRSLREVRSVLNKQKTAYEIRL